MSTPGQAPIAATALSRQTGLIAADGYTHAIRLTLTGPSAQCGAGPIVRTLAGRFDPTDPLSCPACYSTLVDSR